MGKHCYNAGTLARSLEWFEEAWYLAGKEGNVTLRQDQVHTFLDHAAKQVKITWYICTKVERLRYLDKHK